MFVYHESSKSYGRHSNIPPYDVTVLSCKFMSLTLDFMGREFVRERNLYGYVKWTIQFVNTHLTNVLIIFCTIQTSYKEYYLSHILNLKVVDMFWSHLCAMIEDC